MEFMDLYPRIWIKRERERDEMQVLLFKYFFFFPLNPMQFLLSFAKMV